MRFYATGTFPGAKEKSDQMVKWLNELKHRMSNELSSAQKRGELKARKQFKEILYKFVFSAHHKAILISTNWDTVIDKEINMLGEGNYPDPGSNITALHIHGSIDDPHGLYLPSEVVGEPYRSKADDIKMGHYTEQLGKL